MQLSSREMASRHTNTETAVNHDSPTCTFLSRKLFHSLLQINLYKHIEVFLNHTTTRKNILKVCCSAFLNKDCNPAASQSFAARHKRYILLSLQRHDESSVSLLELSIAMLLMFGGIPFWTTPVVCIQQAFSRRLKTCLLYANCAHDAAEAAWIAATWSCHLLLFF